MNIIPAPLAGWSDYAFRRVLVKCGAREVWTEMIAVEGLYRDNAKTIAMLKRVPGRVYQVVQLFGNDPEHLLNVIRSGVLAGYDEVNLNLGCPAPKIIKNGCGCALMKQPARAEQLIRAGRAATHATGQKFSVKMRLGWAENVAVEFAQLCERAGVDRLIVHGRLGQDGYRGTADYPSIAAVKAAVHIPVIANGDIRDRATAEQCLQITRADGVMIGRALLGAPWKIKLDGRTPTPRRVRHLYQLQQKWHTGNPHDLIKHQLAYQKFWRQK